jgi:hypothetical protein
MKVLLGLMEVRFRKTAGRVVEPAYEVCVVNLVGLSRASFPFATSTAIGIRRQRLTLLRLGWQKQRSF